MSFRHQPKAARNLRRLLRPSMRLLTEIILSRDQEIGVTWPPIFVGRGADDNHHTRLTVSCRYMVVTPHDREELPIRLTKLGNHFFAKPLQVLQAGGEVIRQIVK